MPWIAKLDAKAQTWPVVGLWLYLGAKWALILLGAWCLGGVLLDRMGIIKL